jgi:ADP-heptose:LPS heptosyltransferase
MKKFHSAVLFLNAGVGDFLMALYLAEQLKKQGVTEHVVIVVHKGAPFLRGLINGYPYISLIEISFHRPLTLRFLLRIMRPGNLVILPPTIGRFLLRTKFLAWLLAKPDGKLIGFQDNGPLCSLYTNVLPYKLDQNFAESMRDVVRALGLTPTENEPRLHIEPSRGILSKVGLASEQAYVVLHPRGASLRRQLSLEEVLALIRGILAIRPSLQVVVSGAEHERAEIERIVSDAKDERVRAAIGATPAELAALINGAELFMGMDTGITHMACFLGQKVLVIAKNATANWLPYYAKNATVIYRFAGEEAAHTSEPYMWENQKGKIRPFTDVPMEAVLKELERMLGVAR